MKKYRLLILFVVAALMGLLLSNTNSVSAQITCIPTSGGGMHCYTPQPTSAPTSVPNNGSSVILVPVTGNCSSSQHTVQPQQTLSGIAQIRNVTLQSLLTANNLNMNSTIYPGQCLNLSGAAAVVMPTSTPGAYIAPPTPVPSNPSGYVWPTPTLSPGANAQQQQNATYNPGGSVSCGRSNDGWTYTVTHSVTGIPSSATVKTFVVFGADGTKYGYGHSGSVTGSYMPSSLVTVKVTYSDNTVDTLYFTLYGCN